MNLSYATIPSPDATMVRLNREIERRYHVEDRKNPNNELSYKPEEKVNEEKLSEIWHMHGAYSRFGKDSERVEAIENIPLPPTNKVLQSFFGKINFVRRFIPSFAKVAKSISKLLKKDIRFQWDEQG